MTESCNALAINSAREEHSSEKTSHVNQLLNMDGEIHGTPFLLFLKDLKGRYLDANKTKLHYFGFKNYLTRGISPYVSPRYTMI